MGAAKTKRKHGSRDRDDGRDPSWTKGCAHRTLRASAPMVLRECPHANASGATCVQTSMRLIDGALTLWVS
jgi:hypothetical protein